MGVITFNGKNSSEFGLTVTKCPYPNKPARRGTVLQIPGRSGNLVIEDGTYENVILKFDVDISAYHQYGIYDLASKIANWLLGSSGYQKLSTDYEPDTFRLARFSGPMEIESILLFDGRATLEFDCYPQRFESLGHVYSDYGSLSSGSATITNTGIMIAKPMIKVTGKGYVALEFSNEATTDTTEVGIQFSEDQTETIILDCDLHDAYYADGSNANAVVSFRDPYGRVPEDTHYFYPTFPMFYPGKNTIAIGDFSTGTLSSLKIMPRWWSL